VIEAIAEAFRSNADVHLLQVDADPSTNRTVYTLVGSPRALIQVLLNACDVAFRLIDMRTHHGEHKRLGALDVCPFVPVRNATMADCVVLAEQFGQALADRLDVPVFLYGEAARSAARRQVPTIREGEYEALAERLQSPLWKPDFGPSTFVASWGASIVGARQFLIAYNVNLACTRQQANTIAFNLRESGRPQKQQPGRLVGVQAMGWIVDEANLAQVTANILDHHRTPLHRVWNEVVADAAQMGIPVFGSEIVGVVPLDALIAAADHFIDTERLLVLGEEAKVRLAVHRLGLSYLQDFRPEERVIEYILRRKSKQSELDTKVKGERQPFRLEGLRGLQLCGSSVERLVEQVSNREPVPGGGSVSALIGSLGAALAVMVGRLSSGSAAYAHNEAAVRQLLPPLHDAWEACLTVVDSDSDAFEHLMTAVRAKSGVEALEAAKRKCIQVPLRLASKIDSLWPHLIQLNEIKNENTSSDLLVAGFSFVAAIQGALANVEINLDSSLAPTYVEQVSFDLFSDLCALRNSLSL
jgi:glutamate formiminotransferase/formiminotetrahydrofolate cyclodeaminase